jgi:voltage-gated potassium channel
MSIVLLVIVLGTLMYIIEGPMGEKNPGFEDIPNSMYWAIVTLTTVGYGSAVPITAIGKFLASIIMILGYGIIAVPTGIVSAAIVRNKINPNTFRCDSCLSEGHNPLAKFCKDCGEELFLD